MGMTYVSWKSTNSWHSLPKKRAFCSWTRAGGLTNTGWKGCFTTTGSISPQQATNVWPGLSPPGSTHWTWATSNKALGATGNFRCRASTPARRHSGPHPPRTTAEHTHRWIGSTADSHFRRYRREPRGCSRNQPTRCTPQACTRSPHRRMSPRARRPKRPASTIPTPRAGAGRHRGVQLWWHRFDLRGNAGEFEDKVHLN